MSPDAAESWPHPELIESFHGRFDFEAPPSPPETPADAEADARFRTVLGRFASGVTVIAAQTAEGPVGMTCQSFSSVSLEPPLVMFCPAKTSRAWPLMQRAGFFCVNILAAGQADVSTAMATKGTDKFDGIEWRPASTGAPLLNGVVGYVDCTVHSVHEAGDHYVVLGRVRELGFGTGHDADAQAPLLYFRGSYDTVAGAAG
jgi:3-hydroxy-9,10-secoandrosta-1,3,5(10)-triene-9,17-dione monooxygenase reductase component